MKNIHILPTDKPSRLHCYDWSSYGLSKEHLQWKQGRNIYITSDEEIKEIDWVTNGVEVFKPLDLPEYSLEYANRYWEKIILTTDPDLIADGVQGIDNEFLEWFVKNPSCEDVEIISMSRCCGRCDGVDDLCFTDMCCNDHQEYGCEICYGKRTQYKIIIPKEEPKSFIVTTIKPSGTPYDLISGQSTSGIEPVRQENFYIRKAGNRETLEEAAERIAYDSTEANKGFHSMKMFIEGAKWQAERMYSEEEVEQMINSFEKLCYNYQSNKDWFPSKKSEWFKQLKKK